MRKAVSCGAIAALAVLVWGASGATPPKKKAPAKAGTAAKKKSSASSSGAKTTPGAKTTVARGGKKAAPAPRTTWRNRQMAPAPERYKEIQEALVAKGYLKQEEANGAWSPASTEALKKFQSEQNLDSSGRINSLSLIALGLGPKRDSAPIVKPPAAQPVPELPGPAGPAR